MYLRFPTAHRFFLAILMFSCLLSAQGEAAYSKPTDDPSSLDLRKPHIFSMLACVTWWSHDAVGYHPAMCLYLENISGHPLTNSSAGSRSTEEIPFQGRFTDLRSGDVTVAREYRRAPIASHERFSIILRGPKSYDLPIDSSLWPSIECKAMCRIDDSEPEDLFLGHLVSITMSDEDAQALLVAQAGRNPLLIRDKSLGSGKLTNLQMQDVTDPSEGVNIRGLSASHDPSTATTGSAARGRPIKHLIKSALNSSVPNGKSVNTSWPKSVPALGNDFYAFEKLFGSATEFQAGTGGDDLTWTHYKSNGLITDVYVGSRSANKADVVILSFSANATVKDKDILLLGKQLAGCGKSDPITPFAHSVRYSSAGRTEFMTTAIRECRILSFKLSNGAVLAVSRLPGNLEAAIANYGKRVNFLKFIGAVATNSD